MWALQLVINIVHIHIVFDCNIASTLTKDTFLTMITGDISYCPIDGIEDGSLRKRNAVFEIFLICRMFFPSSIFTLRKNIYFGAP